MIQASFPAMGTTVEVIVGDRPRLDATRALFSDLEDRFSRFRADSELSRLNTSADTVSRVSDQMSELLTIAQRLGRRTSGRVDPAVGSAVVQWGYEKTFEEIENIDQVPPQTWKGSWSIDGHMLTREPGVSLDLGGLAKGWAADLAVESGRALLASAGGDMRSVIPDTHVEVGDHAPPVTVHLGNGGLATSSAAKRRWKAGAHEAHHIIDPSTMAPARSPVMGATAVCATAVEAEAAAKTIILEGEQGLTWAERQPWIDRAMVTWHDGSVFATRGWDLVA